MAGEAPLLPENRLEQRRTRAARLSIGTVIGSHHRFHPSFPHQRLKGGQVRLSKIPRRHSSIKLMPQGLRSAVDREMLGTGGGLENPVPHLLDSLNKGDTHAAGEERILAIGLLTAAPPGIPKDIDVWCPEGQPLVLPPTAGGLGGVVLGAPLVGDNSRHFPQEFGIKGGSQTDRLRKDGSSPGAGNAVQALVPPVVLRNPQPLDAGAFVKELPRLFLERETGDQVVGTFFRGARGILPDVVIIAHGVSSFLWFPGRFSL